MEEGKIRDPYKESCTTTEKDGIYSSTHPVQKAAESSSPVVGEIEPTKAKVVMSGAKEEMMKPETVPNPLDNGKL